MPPALLLALVASLGLHLVALFGAEFDLSSEPEPSPIMAELRPLPAPSPPSERIDKPVEPEVVKPAATPPPNKKNPLRPKARAKAKAAVDATPVLSVPEAAVPAPIEAPTEPETPEAAPVEPIPKPVDQVAGHRLPERGTIQYRVDRGDANFEIGFARHLWEISDGHYRLTSLVETTGLAWLFRPIHSEMESRGTVTADGLRPDFFVMLKNSDGDRERIFFDWETMKARVGNRADQDLPVGAQDLLSFNYQLGFLPDLATGSTLMIAHGKKFKTYRLEVLGDEHIEIPAGTFRTLHLRAPGEKTTELWLAYDYLLLPVKIRHVDGDGDSYVQVATQIQLSPE
jgi:hypothetical protein